MINKADVEELFFLLSGELEKEVALKLSKDIGVWVLEKYKLQLKRDLDVLTISENNVSKKYDGGLFYKGVAASYDVRREENRLKVEETNNRLIELLKI
jgi:hypothetical protein